MTQSPEKDTDRTEIKLVDKTLFGSFNEKFLGRRLQVNLNEIFC